MMNSIASFDITQALTTYAPYTARKIVLQLYNMNGIEQAFNITINYRDAVTNDPFSETYAVDTFPANLVFTTNHTGNIILDSIESDYTGSGTCDGYMYEYEYTSSEDIAYGITISSLYVLSDNNANLSQASYIKNNSFGILIHYWNGTVGDIIKVTAKGITTSGLSIIETLYVRDTEDYIRLSNNFFILTEIITERLSGHTTNGQLDIKSNTNLGFANVLMLGNPQINGNENVQFNTGYALSKPSSQILFLGVYGNDNVTNEYINYIGNYNNGSNSISGSMLVYPTSGDSQIKLLLSPDIQFLDSFIMTSYSGSTGNMQWGIIQLPEAVVANTPPYVYAGILNQTVNVGVNQTINLESTGSEVFKDNENDPLTYQIIEETNFNDTSFVSVSGHYLSINPTQSQAGKTFYFRLRATDPSNASADTWFYVDVPDDGNNQSNPMIIISLEADKIAFALEETDTHYKAVGWFDAQSMTIQSIIEPTIELTGFNVIMSKDYISKNPDKFIVQELH